MINFKTLMVRSGFAFAGILFFLVCPSIGHSQISLTGDYSPTYDGSDPWNAGSLLQVGGTATGTMDIENGSTVNSGTSFLGRHTGSSGTVQVTGPGSLWDNSGNMFIGFDGVGGLEISNGAVVMASLFFVGENATGSGTVNVDGGQFQVFGGRVGVNGDGTLNVLNGGSVSTGGFVIGDRTGSSGHITVNGTGSSFMTSASSAASLIVGQQGTGQLDVLGGAFVSGSEVTIGSSSSTGGPSDVNVNGPGSQMQVVGDINVGNAGSGNLTITNGAVVTNGRTFIARYGASVGNATVEGSGSQWNMTGRLDMGNSGQATLNVRNGGSVSVNNNNNATVERGSTINIDGAGASMTVTGNLDLADSFTNGNLNVLNGGHLTTSRGRIATISNGSGSGFATVDGFGSLWQTNDMFIGPSGTSASGQGVLNIQDGGIVEVATFLRVNSSGVINLSGGELIANQLQVDPGGVFDMTGGSLDVESLSQSGNFVQSGGVLSPGDSPGLMNINSGYDMTGGSIEFEIAGLLRGTEYDGVNVLGTATLDGTMEVLLLNGFSPMEGNTFQLINANGFAGTPIFDFSGAQLQSGLAWDTSSFLTNGSISVGVAAIPEPAGGFVVVAFGALFAVRRGRRKPSAR